MHTTSRTRRVRALILGGLLAGVLSVSALSGAAANDDAGSESATSVTAKIETGGTPMSLRGGIRW